MLTKLINVTNEEQIIEKYLINASLHQMIRDSPHNVKSMTSQMNAATTTAPDPTGAPAVPVGADTASAVVVNV